MNMVKDLEKEDYLGSLTKKELIGIIRSARDENRIYDFYEKKCRIMQRTINRLQRRVNERL